MKKNKKGIKINIGIIGGDKVGKTNLINKFCNNSFSDEYLPTIGIDLFNKIMELNNQQYPLCLYDISGQERFRSLSISSLKKWDIIIIVYDITNSISFKELNYWINLVKEYKGNDCIIGIVGNKNDLSEEREVSEEEAMEVAQEYNFPLM